MIISESLPKVRFRVMVYIDSMYIIQTSFIIVKYIVYISIMFTVRNYHITE